MSGQIYVISGPSGSGKSTLIELLIKRVPGIGYSISHTSRKPRDNEVNTVDYHFVNRKTFMTMIEDGSFVEWAEVYDDFYGTSSSSLRDQMNQGLDVAMDLDSKGAENIKKHYKDSILIYILPPSLKILEKRLKNRAMDNEKVIKTRIKRAVAELQDCVWYDYIIINDDLDEALEKVKSIVISDRCRNSYMQPRIKEMLGL
jgi:guanylate kinase